VRLAALVEIYGWAVKSGGGTLFGMCIFTSGFLGLLVLGMTTALTRLSCAEFGANVHNPGQAIRQAKSSH
jgi:hypothetical protein